MRHLAKVLLSCLALAFSLAGALRADPIGDALAMIDGGRLSEARSYLEAIVDGPGAAAERADALELLGDVAVWEDDLEEARAVWRRVTEEFPGTKAASYARTKLHLMAGSLGAEAAPAETARAAQGVEELAAPAESVAPASTAWEAEAAEVAASPESLRDEPQPSPGSVLLAGDGAPVEAIERVMVLLREHLEAAGVEVETPPTTLWWRRELEMAEAGLFEAAAGRPLLWVDFRFGHREAINLRCLEGRGRVTWREKVSGGLGFADHRPLDPFNADLVERLLEKIDRRLGGACLTTGG